MPKFYDNWCEPQIDNDTIIWKINLEPDQIDSIDPSQINNYAIQSVRLLQQELGDRPALCLSGGIDSQVMVDCFILAEATFDVVIMRFPDELNYHDIKSAVQFCESRNIDYRFIDIDVISFLNRDLMSMAERHNVSSPQFAVHFKLFEALQDLGYTSAVCGGNTLLNSSDGWTCPTTKEQNDWREFSGKSGFYVMGDFLSYYWKFSLLLSSNTEKSILFDSKVLGVLSSLDNYDEMVAKRYTAKCSGYIASGFDIIPQETKLTGFERVKEYYHEQTGDGWTFEKQFRTPLLLKNPAPRKAKLILTVEQEAALNILYDKCSRSRISPTRITD